MAGARPRSAELDRLRRLNSTRSTGEFKKLVKNFDGRLNVVAEGDSWFAYPSKNLLGTNNVITHLKKFKKMNLLQLAQNGDEAVNMLSGKSKRRLVKLLKATDIDILLFSGGGNDVVGEYDFDFFLRDKSKVKSSPSSWKDYVYMARLNRRLNQIRNAYIDLLDYVGAYSKNKNIKVVTHTYDYVIPSKKGAVFLFGTIKLKAWMGPFLIEKGVPKKYHREIARNLIDGMAKTLTDLQAQYPNRLVVADTRNIVKGDWLNEIHPNKKGFKKVAEKIWKDMGNAGLV